MKIMFLLSVASATVLGTFAQGTINVGNYFGSAVFGAPIYGLPFPYTGYGQEVGQSSLGFPTGATVYTGPLLQGTGFTFSVF